MALGSWWAPAKTGFQHILAGFHCPPGSSCGSRLPITPHELRLQAGTQEPRLPVGLSTRPTTAEPSIQHTSAPGWFPGLQVPAHPSSRQALKDLALIDPNPVNSSAKRKKNCQPRLLFTQQSCLPKIER